MSSLGLTGLLSCCLLTLDSHRTRFTELYICTRIFFFLIVTENITVCVCVCVCVVLCVCVFCFDLGIFCTKKKPHGQKSGARQSFHTELDVFYGNW